MIAPVPPLAPVRPVAGPAREAASTPPSVVPPASGGSATVVGAHAVPAVEPADRAAAIAAERLLGGREVEVSGFHDAGSGRFVYRVTDRYSGEVLTQLPSEELLRLYAGLRAEAAPQMRVEA
jgi:hypothetical protein